MVVTITLGQLLQIAVTIGGLIMLYVGIERRLASMETKLDPLWRAFERRRGETGTTGRLP